MLRQLLGMAALRRMGPMGKFMIAAQVGRMAYGAYKQNRARKVTREAAARNGVGLHEVGPDGLGAQAGRPAKPLNPFG